MPSGIYDRQKYKNPPKSKSGLKGVQYCPACSKPWKAYIRKDGHFHCLGYFATKEEAGMRYNREARKIYGPEAFLNQIWNF